MPTITAQFAPIDAHFADCDAGKNALQEYELAREQGHDHIESVIRASNVLQRAGYNVNAKGGVSIDWNPDVVTHDGRLHDYAAVVNLMDDEIREELNGSWDGEGETEAEQNQRFVDQYAERHEAKFGSPFVVN